MGLPLWTLTNARLSEMQTRHVRNWPGRLCQGGTRAERPLIFCELVVSCGVCDVVPLLLM
jgi:hypothetical protein